MVLVLSFCIHYQLDFYFDMVQNNKKHSENIASCGDNMLYLSKGISL